MIVHEFIQGNKPIMVLIHGVLTPWQVWTEQINFFKGKYNIYAVALNAHTEEVASKFVSLSDESEEIISYFTEKNILNIDVLCGISLGGKIAHEIWKSSKIKIRCLVMDGAPLVPCPIIAINVMIKNYRNIIRKSKVRDEKVIKNFKKNFLPEKFLDSYLKIADFMTYESIENIVKSAFSGGEIGKDNDTDILFIHGTKGNEILSKKSAKLVKKFNHNAKVICFKGDNHCHKAIYQPEIWANAVKNFLEESFYNVQGENNG